MQLNIFNCIMFWGHSELVGLLNTDQFVSFIQLYNHPKQLKAVDNLCGSTPSTLKMSKYNLVLLLCDRV